MLLHANDWENTWQGQSSPSSTFLQHQSFRSTNLSLDQFLLFVWSIYRSVNLCFLLGHFIKQAVQIATGKCGAWTTRRAGRHRAGAGHLAEWWVAQASLPPIRFLPSLFSERWQCCLVDDDQENDVDSGFKNAANFFEITKFRRDRPGLNLKITDFLNSNSILKKNM
jgi:hypothetical protein